MNFIHYKQLYLESTVHQNCSKINIENRDEVLLGWANTDRRLFEVEPYGLYHQKIISFILPVISITIISEDCWCMFLCYYFAIAYQKVIFKSNFATGFFRKNPTYEIFNWIFSCRKWWRLFWFQMILFAWRQCFQFVMLKWVCFSIRIKYSCMFVNCP